MATKNLVRPDQYLLPSIKKGLSKKQIGKLVDASVKNILESGNILKTVEVLSVMDEFIKGVRKNYEFVDYLRDELAKHQGKYISKDSVKIELCEVGFVYDYSNDKSWQELNKQFEEIDGKKKALEEMLRKIPDGKVIVDPDTGEAWAGPAKSSKSGYKVTLAKE